MEPVVERNLNFALKNSALKTRILFEEYSLRNLPFAGTTALGIILKSK